MDYTYEIIQTDDKLPLNIFFHNVRYVPNHWHDSMELLFVLKGKTTIVVQNKPFILHEEDIILINSNEIHTIQSDHDNLLLALQIPDSFLKEQGIDSEHMSFNCHSFWSGPEEQGKFDEIRTLVSTIMWVYNKAGYGYEVKIRSLLLDLLYLLLRKFRSGQKPKDNQISKRTMDRLLHLNEYIQNHFNEQLTLNELAERENFSVPYLSSFFQKSMGVSFRAYITRIRLEHAVKDLLTSDYPIIQVALDNGFPNLKSFHKAFKDVYHTTPAEYRKQRDANIETKNLSKHEGTSYLSYDRDNAYVSLFKYLPTQSNEPAAKLSGQSIMVKEYDIRVSGSGKPIKHTWKTLCTIGKAKEALYGPVQEHLKMIQEIVHFRYIRFHGIFDDEMMVYRKDAKGEPVFNFTYVDRVIDFLRSIGLRPFFELGFMPGELADKSKTIFYKKSYVSLPQNNEHWTSLLQSFIRHLASRYGAEEIKTWYFEFWNEPDVKLFWPYSFEEFTLFYRNSYRALKSVSPDLRIGGPSIVSDSLIKSDWIERYMTFCAQHDCRPDFITFHMYPLLLERGTLENIDSPTGVQYAGEDYVKETIMKVKQTLRKWGAPGAELHVTEWNSTPHHRELTNDTCYKSAYIVKNIIENIDQVGSMGYWTVTDLLEELPLPAETFHGGLGLITNNGVKKPGFYAYELLAKLGDRLLDLGESYCLTMSQDGSYQLLLYHYCHFDQLYSMNDTSAIGSFNRYDVFTDSGQLNLTFRMDGIPAGNYEIRKYAINREHGSSYDLWLDMGHPEGMTPQDVQYLNMRSMPRQTVKQEAIGESFAISCSLSPHEVQLLEIRPVY